MHRKHLIHSRAYYEPVDENRNMKASIPVIDHSPNHFFEHTPGDGHLTPVIGRPPLRQFVLTDCDVSHINKVGDHIPHDPVHGKHLLNIASPGRGDIHSQRGRVARVSRRAHNSKIDGSNPSPAIHKKMC